MSVPRGVGAAVVCAAMLVLGVPSAAVALAPNTWGPASPLPLGTTSVGDQVLSSPTGTLLRYSVTSSRPALATFGPDGLGAAAAIPGAPSGALPGPVAFLPDGSAVVSYYQFYTGPLWLVVRLADGTFGAAYKLPNGAQSFAARAGEVLILGAASLSGVSQVTASSLTIGAGGTLTSTGAPAVIYSSPGPLVDLYGTQISVPVAALDADGQADALIRVDHVSTSGNEILEMHRTAAGAWGAPQSLTAGLPGAASASEPKAAVAPGGRTLIAFETGGSLTKSTLWRSLREPGGTFPTPSMVNDIRGVGGASNTTLAAAGGDGTLAIAVYAFTCQSMSASEVRLQTLTTLIAAPSGPLGSYNVGVLDSATDHSRMLSLGAGGGQAIVGLNDQKVTSGNPDNTCDTPPLNNNAGTVSDRVSIVGPDGTGDQTFGIGSYASTGNGSVVLGVDAAGISATRDAAVTGRLGTSGVPASAYFQGTPPAPAVGGGPPSPGAVPPAPAPSPPAPVNTASPTPRAGPFTLSAAGIVSFTLTAPRFSNPRDVLGVQMLLQVFSGRGSSASLGASRAKQPKNRLIGAVRKTVSLRSGQKLVARLTLTSKLRTYLRRHPSALVKLQLTSTQTGRKKTVKVLAVRVKRKG